MKSESISIKALTISLLIAIILVAAEEVGQTYYSPTGFSSAIRDFFSPGSLVGMSVIILIITGAYFIVILPALSAIKSSKLLQTKHVGEILLYASLIASAAFNAYFMFSSAEPVPGAEIGGGLMVCVVVLFTFGLAILDCAFYLIILLNRLFTRNNAPAKQEANFSDDRGNK